MKTRTIYRVTIDILMIILMLVVIAARFTGDIIHEILGIALFMLFILHNLLNWRWYRALLKGIYNALRIIRTVISLLLLVTILALMISAVLISHNVFAFLGLNGGLLGRQIHMLAAYWALILVAIHLGMYWEVIMNGVRKLTKIYSTNRSRTFVLRMRVLIIAIYGVNPSFIRDIGSKLILYYTFDFWNFQQHPIFFFLDYLSIVVLYASCTHYIMKSRIVQRQLY